MIRNVVMGTVRDGVTAEQLEQALTAIQQLRVDGVELRTALGPDLGLREGNAAFAITVDLVDEDAYRRYDLDEEHNRIRRELFAPIAASIQRVQFHIPD